MEKSVDKSVDKSVEKSVENGGDKCFLSTMKYETQHYLESLFVGG